MYVSARPAPWAASAAVHGIALSLWLLLPGILPQERSPPVVRVTPVGLTLPPPLRLPALSQAGGSGGAAAKTPATLGEAPKIRAKAFVPPQAEPRPEAPLVLEAAIDLPANATVPTFNAAHWGNPFAPPGLPSSGRGCCSGIGEGKRGKGGIGNGDGRSIGDGDGVLRAGIGGVSLPVVVFRPDPEYSEDARKARFQGVVLVEIVVDPSGATRDVRVVNSAGLGLDEKATEAVSRWRFRPAKKDGKPVPVRATVEVHFRLL